MSQQTPANLPSYRDVAPGDAPWCLCAAEHFYGKTLEEAEALFDAAGCPLTYIEDLDWMAPAGFQFYVQAAIRSCLNPKRAGDPDFINGLAGTISRWRDSHPEVVKPCARVFADFCNAILRDFHRYEADPEIYTGLKEEYEDLADYFTRIDSGAQP